MSKKTLMLSIAFLTATAFSGEVLNIDFDKKPEKLEIKNETLRINGTYDENNFYSCGPNGIPIPLDAKLEKSGSFYISFMLKDFQEPKTKLRFFFMLRCKSRLEAGFCLSPSNSKLSFMFTDQINKYHYSLAKPLMKDKLYQAVFTYNGENIQIYLDGILLATAKQPCPVEKIWRLNIGPVKDNYYTFPPAGDDIFVKNVKVFDNALTPDEIAELCGVKTKTVNEVFPAEVTVPYLKTTGLKKKLLTDAEWDKIGTIFDLIDSKNLNKSFELPPSTIKIAADNENLYFKFNTLYPNDEPLKTGVKDATEVFTDESLEIYLKSGNDTYRFAVNPAGAKCISKNIKTMPNDNWTFDSTIKRRIDDRLIWDGQIVIPWETINLKSTPKSELLFNFCHTFRRSDLSTFTSLGIFPNYNDVRNFSKLNFNETITRVNIKSQENPAQGLLKQNIEFWKNSNSEIEYKVILTNLNSTIPPIEIVNKKIKLKANENFELLINEQFQNNSFNLMVFKISENGKNILTRYFPFKISNDYIDILPSFTNENINLKVKIDLLSNAPNYRGVSIDILSPNGKIFKEIKSAKKDNLINFSRENPAGIYTVILKNTKNEVINKKEFFYPGIGEWENIVWDNRIIPPLTPLKIESHKQNIAIEMFGRKYIWNNSFFISQLFSKNAELLQAPITIEANGKSIKSDSLKLIKSDRHRAELTGTSKTDEYTCNLDAWIEYDGVQFNKITIKAEKDLTSLKIKLPLKSESAKYLHTSKDYQSWGSRITSKIKDGISDISYFPTIWLGDEEKGLCFFAESRENWRSAASKTYRIIKDKNSVLLEVNIADTLKKGETINFEFGLLASPVRPLPDNYLLDNFADNWLFPVNRDNLPPTISYSVTTSKLDVSNFFIDLPVENQVELIKALNSEIEFAKAKNNRLLPYMCSRYLSSEYPIAMAFRDDWRIQPDLTVSYQKGDKKHFIYDVCPTTKAANYYIWKLKNYLKDVKFSGVYLDFGLVPNCNNIKHGCHNKTPLLAQREFHRRLMLTMLDAGIKNPVIVLHNTDAVQLPAMTFATHLLNGEQIRQASSPVLHNGKDVLDSMNLDSFASEYSSMPWGLTNNVYMPFDALLKQYGGTGEDVELYKFRMTLAALAPALIHNTIPSPMRGHIGVYDKINRIYDKFGAPNADFIGYWREPATVIDGKDIKVSVYLKKSEKKLLAIISHIGHEHLNQNVKIKFDSKKIGEIIQINELLSADDPDYQLLYQLRTKSGYPNYRVPLKLGDFGIKNPSLQSGVLSFDLNFHRFAIFECTIK